MLLPLRIRKQKTELAYFMCRLYERGLTTTSGGNISMRLDDKILITPSQIDKARLTSKQIALIGLDGKNYTPHLKPSIETAMHLATYKMRNDVHAIVHAHPAIATTFACSSKKINTHLIAESSVIAQTPVMAPYALMGTDALAAVVAESLRFSNCVLMQNHGVICVGKNILEAFDRMEVLEAAAKMTIIAEIIGSCESLTEDQLLCLMLQFNK